jgi:hypothetical protein
MLPTIHCRKMMKIIVLSQMILFVATVSALEGKDVNGDLYTRLKTADSRLTDDVLRTVTSGLHRLLQLALRHSETSLKQEVSSGVKA